MVMDDPTLPRIKVRDLLMQAFLTGWTRKVLKRSVLFLIL